MNAPQNIGLAERQYRSRSYEADHGNHDETLVQEPNLSTGPFPTSYPVLFLLMAILSLYLYDWSTHWWLSGAPLLSFSMMKANMGPLRSNFYLLLMSLTYVNILYILFSTSWLFSAFYQAIAFPSILLLSLCTNHAMQRKTRRLLRYILRQFHFCDDKIAFFDIPALDIDDGEVPCLLVIRGVTFTLSTMTFEVHGVEVGIRLNNDMEISIQTESVTWRVFREISIGDVYTNVKTAQTMLSRPADGEGDHGEAIKSLTNNKAPDDLKPSESVTDQLTSQDDRDNNALVLYQQRLLEISRSITTIQARRHVSPTVSGINKVKAAIGSRIHNDKAVPNPPRKQLKSSALTARVPGLLKELFRNCPILLRLFLNPISYNHPVHIKSIVLTGCGVYVFEILEKHFFKAHDQESTELQKLKSAIEDYVATVSFIKVPNLFVYKTVEMDESGNEIECIEDAAELGGMAATFTIPSALLPHHEHLLPEPPRNLNDPDCLNVKMSVLGSLPGKLNASMVGFAITMLKASQILTIQKNATSMSEEVNSAADFGKSLKNAAIEQTKKKLVEAHIDDAWLTKILHKAVHGLGTAKGDVGYQMDLPVDLKKLRPSRFVPRSGSVPFTPVPSG